DVMQQLYEGIFTRIAKTHPLDYYWFWTPENWTWEDVPESTVHTAIEDILTAVTAAGAAKAPFQLATCGWVLGPQFDRALFDARLPKNLPISCISRAVGHDPVEPGFAKVSDRDKWAIPWLEDDPAMTSPQLWAGRMRRDAYDARQYGCTGLMGIHWRTMILGPNVSALAQAAWEQDSWASRKKETKDEKNAVIWPVDDFYGDWAAHQFGPAGGKAIAAIFEKIDGKLPRPSDWVDGPGGYRPDERPWSEVANEYAFVDELAALRPQVQGPGNLARFDYWLANFQYLRATGEMRCHWAAYDKAMKQVKAESDAGRRSALAREQALPLREKMVAAVTDAYTNLLATVNTSGAMGTVANLEQHTFPGMLDKPGEELAKQLGGELPASAQLPAVYDGPARVIVPTVRGSLTQGETLQLKVIVLAGKAPKTVEVCWRDMGTVEYQTVPLENAARGVYKAAIAAKADFEYYVRVVPETGDALVWPPTAPETNQTVIFMPPVG
ncbi:MAG: hypothetical protein QG656_972, partial [Candidatus Hydrogenedentes bacterium]|nr:hypothetical protein [Candidatus Hydrogenedentota bacterium]